MLHRNWKATGLGGISLALLAAGTLAGSTGTSVALAAAAGDGTVTVRVVTEVDADGAYDSVLEPGLPGVTVTLTDDAGASLTATTGADGTAVFTPSSSALTGGKYRIQVANPDPDTLAPAIAGLGTGADVIRSGVGFVEVGGGTDVTYTTGFWEPDLYCQENPALVTCGLAKGDATGQQGLVSFASDFAGHQDGPLTQLTDNTQQKAVFGIGTDRTGNVYAGTSVKRHTEYGPEGPVNAVYRYNATSKALTTFVTLPGALTAHDKDNSYLHDDAVYAKVGREGLGDIDVSGDGKTLYAVNLNDAKLYAVPIQGTGDAVTAGTPASYAVPEPASCVGDWHPYGIGVRGARVLVGGVCGAETTVGDVAWGDPSRLSGHVYEFKGGQFSELFTHGLDYPRGCAYRFTGSPDTFYRCDDNTTVGQRMSADWEAWNERVPVKEEHGFVAAPQPMLANIEIADNGDLILGYRDRFADMQGNGTYSYGSTTTQVSAVAAGDTLRACVSGTTYTLENNGGCGGLTGALPGDERGPGGGEFYSDFTTLADAQHDQIAEGGLVLQPYRNKLWTTTFDPYTNQAYEQGVRRWTADSGAIEANLKLKSTWSDGANLFGKGNGLADLEMICDQAPVQIGNRVWYDSDGDGVQDPSEPPVAGVKVTLKDKDGNTLTTTTDANGEYYVGTADGLKPNTEYEVTFDYSGIDTSKLPGKPALDEIKWTQKEAGSDRAIDSNVDPAGKTTVKVGDPGHVNHDVDAGLVGPVNKLGDYVWYDTDGDGIQDKDEKGAKGITVKLVDPKTGKVIRTTTTDENGKYLFTDLPDGDYRVCFVKPDGYDWTKQNAGRDGDDSVVNPADGCSPVVTLGPGKRENLTLDAGLVKELGLTVAKTDAKTKKPLAGAVFQLWRDSNGTHGLQRTGPKKDTFVDDCVTGDKGRCSFDDLPAGTYYLVETDVPEGYVLPKRPVTGPYAVTLKTASSKDGLVVKIANKRGEPCKGKC